jgi:hypothetical protein
MTFLETLFDSGWSSFAKNCLKEDYQNYVKRYHNGKSGSETKAFDLSGNA